MVSHVFVKCQCFFGLQYKLYINFQRIFRSVLTMLLIYLFAITLSTTAEPQPQSKWVEIFKLDLFNLRMSYFTMQGVVQKFRTSKKFIRVKSPRCSKRIHEIPWEKKIVKKCRQERSLESLRIHFEESEEGNVFIIESNVVAQAKPKVVLRLLDDVHPVDNDGVLQVEHHPCSGRGLREEEEEGGPGRHHGQHWLRIGQQRLD